MAIPIRVLLLEDTATDAELVIHELQKWIARFPKAPRSPTLFRHAIM